MICLFLIMLSTSIFAQDLDSLNLLKSERKLAEMRLRKTNLEITEIGYKFAALQGETLLALALERKCVSRLEVINAKLNDELAEAGRWDGDENWAEFSGHWICDRKYLRNDVTLVGDIFYKKWSLSVQGGTDPGTRNYISFGPFFKKGNVYVAVRYQAGVAGAMWDSDHQKIKQSYEWKDCYGTGGFIVGWRLDHFRASIAWNPYARWLDFNGDDARLESNDLKLDATWSIFPMIKFRSGYYYDFACDKWTLTAGAGINFNPAKWYIPTWMISTKIYDGGYFSGIDDNIVVVLRSGFQFDLPSR